MPSTRFLVVPFFLAACGSSAPPVATRGGVDTTVLETVRVRMADTLLTLSNGQKRITVPLTDLINSSGGYQHALLDARRGSDGYAYLLARTTGESRAGGGEGHCGAGEETDLVWTAVDSALQVVKTRAVLVASCLRSREPVGAATELAGEPWSIAFYIPGDSVTTVTYDRRAPERGIQTTTAPDSAR